MHVAMVMTFEQQAHALIYCHIDYLVCCDNVGHALQKVQKVRAEGNTYLSLTELLDRADVTETDYVDALETSCTGSPA